MPKDRAEVQDQYKISGGSMNEYEFGQSKGDMEEQEQQRPDDAAAEGLRGAAEPSAPQNVAGRIRQVEEQAHEIVERRRAKSGGAARQQGGAQKAGAKAAGTSAKKASGAAKKPGTAGGAKKGTAKKGGAKKGAARKGGGARR